jgi:hypothetical protein
MSPRGKNRLNRICSKLGIKLLFAQIFQNRNRTHLSLSCVVGNWLEHFRVASE